jgi:hypothetical protein
MITNPSQLWCKNVGRVLRFYDRLCPPTLPIAGDELRVVVEQFRIASQSYGAVHDVLRKAEADSTSDDSSKGSEYPWPQWEADLGAAFANGVPQGFLEHPIVKATMVFHGRRRQASRLRVVRQVFGAEAAADLLVEDPVGRPHLCGRRPVTSPNRLHHASHLAHYVRAVGKPFPSGPLVVEWGGGYGDAARLVRRIVPAVTYVIIDLPAVGALQYVYLASLLGAANVQVVESASMALQRGAVNIMTSGVAFAHPELLADAFMSTWALTESPQALQERVLERDFFNARNVLLAYSMDRDNHVVAAVSRRGGTTRPVPDMTEDGYAPSFYGFV